MSLLLEHIWHVAADAEALVRHYGVFAVALFLALEALGAPLPGETLLIFTSVLAERGEMSLPALLLFAWVGSALGGNLGYLIGRTWGQKAITRYGSKIGLTDARIDAIERLFSRYGSATVLFARFFNILRQLNGIVAGILNMPWWRFLLLNTIGAALWVAAWIFIGTYFSTHTSLVANLTRNTQVVLSIAVIGFMTLVVGLLVRRARRGHW